MYACEALGKMGEKAATTEVISQLVSGLGDQSKDIRMYACVALGRMGEKGATAEVISQLVSRLGDQSEYVRRYACEALGKMGEKAATNVVISHLVSALENQSEHVRKYTCEALGKMGEKAATNEVISQLVIVVGRDRLGESYVAANAISNILSSSVVLVQLDPRIISNLCLSRGTENTLQNISVDQLINVFFSTENPDLLPVVTRFALQKGVAITVVEDKVVVYDRNEPSEVPSRREARRQQVIRAFNGQARQLHLPF